MMCERAVANPNMAADKKFTATARHWRCVLKSSKSRGTMLVYFSQGSAHTVEPTVQEVVDSLAVDVSVVIDNQSFEDFCGEFGYDLDSIKALRTYEACQRELGSLQRLIGESAVKELVYEVECL